MTTRVNFVAAVGRVSMGADSALPKIEGICAKFGGKVLGGVGNSTDPIVAEFTERTAAVSAAQEAFYLDDVEAAKVIGADANAAGGVNESAGAPPVIESADHAIDAVVGGAEVKDAVAKLVEAKKRKKCDDKDDDKGEKKGDK